MFRYDRLDPLIKKSGKTKVSLCAKMGFGPTYLRDAKKQNTNIADEPLRILAKELETTPEYLRGETDDPGIKEARDPKIEGVSPTVQELFDFIDTATDTELNELLRYAQFLMSKR